MVSATALASFIVNMADLKKSKTPVYANIPQTSGVVRRVTSPIPLPRRINFNPDESSSSEVDSQASSLENTPFDEDNLLGDLDKLSIYMEFVFDDEDQELTNDTIDEKIVFDDDAGDREITPLGTLQKGSIDVMGAKVYLVLGGDSNGGRYIVQIVNPITGTAFEVAATSREMAIEWYAAIQEAAESASARTQEHQKMERNLRIAKEISDIIVYCRSVSFNLERAKNKPFIFNEMSSFPETKAEKLICQQENAFFLKYHQNQFSRVYPKGQRIDSSNYNPMPLWNSGCQMVALNYQTPDKSMQVNLAKFKENGNCGYVLRPDFMFDENYKPYDKTTLVGVTPVSVTVCLIGGRHLFKTGRGTVCPFVEIEVIGAEYDSGIKLVTKTISDNGLNPIWNEICEFELANPDLAILRFTVFDEDMFGDPNFIGQSTFLFKSIRTGFRSIQLNNAFSEELELSSLLVHVSITKKST